MNELTEVPEIAPPSPCLAVEFAGQVLEQIRRHARSSMSAEICGVLIGSVSEGRTRVCARIAGEGANQGGAHVTFTQDTWEHIFKIKDGRYPSESIVGWYHSHPGFGIFLSDYDLFIHENFFSAPHQLAWVFDPHSDAEGCFGWADKKVVPLRQFTVTGTYQSPAAEQMAQEEASRQLTGSPTKAGRSSASENGRPRSLWKSLLGICGGVLLGLIAGMALPRYFPERSQAMWSFLSRYLGEPQPQPKPKAPLKPGSIPQEIR